MSEKVIKSTVDALNVLTNQELVEGLNVISLEVIKKHCKLTVTYHIVIPSNQKESTLYGFILLNTIDVTGRGQKKYYPEIYQELMNSFNEAELVENPFSFDESMPVQVRLKGFKRIYTEENKWLFDSVYMEVQSVRFRDVEKIDLTTIGESDRKFTPSIKDNQLVRYSVNNQYGHERDARMLFGSRLYEATGDLESNQSAGSYKLLETTTYYLEDENEYYLLTEDGFIYKSVAEYVTVDEVDSSFQTIIVSNSSLYTMLDVFSNLSSLKFELVYYQQQFYKKDKRASILTATEEPKAFMNTNIESNTVFPGNGLYSSLTIDNKKQVIVPITSCWMTSAPISLFTIVLVEKEMHILVGEADKIGFIQTNYSPTLKIKVDVQPSNLYTNFLSTPNELLELKEDIDKNNVIQFEVFDNDFKNKSVAIHLNQKVQVMKELNDFSQLKGLEGEVIHISNNKQVITVQFFKHFTEKFDINSLKIL